VQTEHELTTWYMRVGLWLATQFSPVLKDGMTYLPQLSYKPMSTLKDYSDKSFKKRVLCYIVQGYTRQVLSYPGY